jgi:release factor glutamine methyltransferase
MKIDSSIKYHVNEGVYSPAEDTYFLIKCIQVKKEKSLDMGTGTGLIALHMARQGAQVTAVDKTPQAVRNAMENAQINNIKIQVIQSDLFSKITDCFDVITFNPPYLPPNGPRNISWDGGQKGIEVAERFLTQAHDHLHKKGRIYLLLSTLGDINYLINRYSDQYNFYLMDVLPLFFEQLHVFKITH